MLAGAQRTTRRHAGGDRFEEAERRLAEAERLYAEATEHSSAGAYDAALTSLGMASDQLADEDSGFLGLRHLLSDSELPDTLRDRRTSLVERAVQLFGEIQRERELVGLRVDLETLLEAAALVEDVAHSDRQRGELESFVSGPASLMEVVKLQQQVERLAGQERVEDLAAAAALGDWNTENGLYDLQRALEFDREIPEGASELAVARVTRDLAVLDGEPDGGFPDELKRVEDLLLQRDGLRESWEAERNAEHSPEAREALDAKLGARVPRRSHAVGDEVRGVCQPGARGRGAEHRLARRARPDDGDPPDRRCTGAQAEARGPQRASSPAGPAQTS